MKVCVPGVSGITVMVKVRMIIYVTMHKLRYRGKAKYERECRETLGGVG